ncbi:hypothetical protein J2S55_003159 [Streptosporangium brasiliense]|uniref:Uncharacterized protein n=1 Tax=Streptosporangium brasiliense TaxID=47480 RepID=A0ABT9R3S8_9ACTN|nr:hypothetical protein [Streptosporangium brasiliense]
MPRACDLHILRAFMVSEGGPQPFAHLLGSQTDPWLDIE